MMMLETTVLMDSIVIKLHMCALCIMVYNFLCPILLHIEPAFQSHYFCLCRHKYCYDKLGRAIGSDGTNSLA
jgi:hypothetical protein